MRKSDISISIDRIILTDLGITPDRAEHLRGLVEGELQRLLAQEGSISNFASAEVSRIDAPKMRLVGPYSDGRLANSIARSAAQALSSVKGE